MKSKSRRKRRSDGSDDSSDSFDYLPQIGVRLPLDQVEELDALAEQSGGRLNRSDIIRQAIDRHLEYLKGLRS